MKSFCFCFKQTNKNYAEFTSKQLKLYLRVLFVFVYAVTRSCVILIVCWGLLLIKLQCLCIPRRLITLSKACVIACFKYISIIAFWKANQTGFEKQLGVPRYESPWPLAHISCRWTFLSGTVPLRFCWKWIQVWQIISIFL